MLQIPEIKIKLSYKKKISPENMVTIKGVDDAFECFKEVFNADTIDWTEEMIMLCLNNANKVVGFYKISSGGMTATIADPRIIFSVALNCGATGILIAHNHPSGNLTPSAADISMTNKIKDAGELLDIRLIDHMILANDDFYSFKEGGKL